MNILLLNPPGTKLYMRDYFCSKSSKSNYYYHPVDLLFLSGILESAGHTVDFIDAVLSELKRQRCISYIARKKYDMVIFLSGGVSWYAEDREFIMLLKESFKGIVVGIGDIFLEEGSKTLSETPALDAILFDFSTSDILSFIRDYKSGRPVRNVLYSCQGRIVEGEIVREKEDFDLPTPLHGIFSKYKYRFPFLKSYPFATVLTDFGCPFKCSFCVIGKLGFKVRTLESVEKELNVLKELKVKEVFFRDQTFGVRKDRTRELCKVIKRVLPGIGWTCFSRVDVMDNLLLKEMKNSGCHTIIFGVESADEELLKKYNKEITVQRVKDIFSMCRANNIRTAATFILGLPGDTEESILRTIKLAKDINCDFASFNIAAPRIGTDLRKLAVDEGIVDKSFVRIDSGYCKPQIETEQLNSKRLWELRKIAIKSFYLRPSYITKRLFSIKTPYELYNSLSEGFGLLKKSE